MVQADTATAGQDLFPAESPRRFFAQSGIVSTGGANPKRALRRNRRGGAGRFRVYFTPNSPFRKTPASTQTRNTND